MASVLILPNTQALLLYLIASARMVFIGSLDDKYDLRNRIVGQIIVASIVIYGKDKYTTMESEGYLDCLIS